MLLNKQELVDRLRHVLIPPRIRPHRPGQHPRAPQELADHEPPLLLAPAHHELERHEVEPVSDRGIDQHVAAREERRALCEGHAPLIVEHHSWVCAVDLVHHLFHPLRILLVHEPAVRTTKRHSHEHHDDVAEDRREEPRERRERRQLERDPAHRLQIVVSQNDVPPRNLLLPQGLVLHYPGIPLEILQKGRRVHAHVTRTDVHAVPVEVDLHKPAAHAVVLEAEQPRAAREEVARIGEALEVDHVRIEERTEQLLARGQHPENV
mmetsp:Transcript_39217/g.96532  ORF Transcript_39217/g.96532 Transcript_39217/m.96532 type:complete len:265 (-) Transcript_39217:227-1021(-)